MIDNRFLQLPTELKERYSTSRGWSALCAKLENALPNISPYIEPNLYDNHFSLKQPDKKVWEGLWQLHVMWALQQKGITLEQPTNSDDIFLKFQDELMAVEVTFTNANDPSTLHHETYENLEQRQASFIEGVDASLVRQLLVVLDGKEQKLVVRQLVIPRFVALNSVLLGNGFSHWDTSLKDMAEKLSQEITQKQYHAIDGVFFDFVEYDEFFSNPKLSPVWHKNEAVKFARQFI